MEDRVDFDASTETREGQRVGGKNVELLSAFRRDRRRDVTHHSLATRRINRQSENLSIVFFFAHFYFLSLSLSIFYPPLNSSISFVLVFYFVQTAITHASRNLNVVSSLLLSNSVLKTHTADRRRRPRIKHRGE